MRAAIYTRLSVDREGTAAGPDRQREDCLKLADTRGWEVVAEHVDRDISAYSGKHRPGYEAALRDLREGRADVVVAWKLDRLSRRGLTGVAELLGAGHVATVADGIDTTTSTGELVAGVLASLAKSESENIGTRVARAHEDAARKHGRPHGGGSRPFGYRRDGDTLVIVPEEAEVIRELAGRILAGESLRSLAFELNARGSGDRKWQGLTVGRTVRSPLVAGYRVHRGVMHKGNWPAILDDETHRRLQETRSTPRALRSHEHLLTGLARCGLCGAYLRATTDGDYRRYACAQGPGRPGCGGVSVARARLDDDIRGRLFRFLTLVQRTPGTGRQVDAPDDLEASLQEDADALKRLSAAHFVDRLIGWDEYLAARGPLTERMATSEAALAALKEDQARFDGARDIFRAESLDEWWDAATPGEKRDAVRAVFTEVTVNPIKRRAGSTYDKSRVTTRTSWRLTLDEPSAPSREYSFPAELLPGVRLLMAGLTEDGQAPGEQTGSDVVDLHPDSTAALLAAAARTA